MVYYFIHWSKNYPQCNLATEWHHRRQFIRLQKPQKVSYSSFHIWSSTPKDLWTYLNDGATWWNWWSYPLKHDCRHSLHARKMPSVLHSDLYITCTHIFIQWVLCSHRMHRCSSQGSQRRTCSQWWDLHSTVSFYSQPGRSASPGPL